MERSGQFYDVMMMSGGRGLNFLDMKRLLHTHGRPKGEATSTRGQKMLCIDEVQTTPTCHHDFIIKSTRPSHFLLDKNKFACNICGLAQREGLGTRLIQNNTQFYFS